MLRVRWCRWWAQDERQKQQDAEWEQKEQERQQALEAKELAERELEERSKQQSEQLASVKAKLDSLKAQKQEMVEKLKQVSWLGPPPCAGMCTGEHDMVQSLAAPASVVTDRSKSSGGSQISSLP